MQPVSSTSGPAQALTPRSSDLQQAQKSFLSVLGKKFEEKAPLSDDAQAKSSAEEFVAMALIQPLLKLLRENSNAAPPFAPSQAEKQFRALSDADVAQRIVKAKQFPLVDAVARSLLKRGGELPTELRNPIAPTTPEVRMKP